jgi:hypothetical protein
MCAITSRFEIQIPLIITDYYRCDYGRVRTVPSESPEKLMTLHVSISNKTLDDGARFRKESSKRSYKGYKFAHRELKSGE